LRKPRAPRKPRASPKPLLQTEPARHRTSFSGKGLRADSMWIFATARLKLD
jgi:hypothetical protein